MPLAGVETRRDSKHLVRLHVHMCYVVMQTSRMWTCVGAHGCVHMCSSIQWDGVAGNSVKRGDGTATGLVF